MEDHLKNENRLSKEWEVYSRFNLYYYLLKIIQKF